MRKVLVTDSLAPEGFEILEKAPGLEVVDAPGLSPADLLAAIADADALVIRSATKVTADVIAAGARLAVIGRAGIGVDNVDVPAATAKGIVVMNTPGGNTVTTAEHALALLIALARHIPQATASMKAGKWEKNRFVGMELYNRTLGVIGLGNIGRIVAERAQGLGMKVIAHDPFLSADAAAKLDVELVDLDALLARADAISVHVPKTKETTGLLGRKAFAKVRQGVLLVNAARGGIVDEDALLEALNSGAVGGAALDVFVEEPAKAGHPLVAHERVICTPHLGASTEQAQVNVSIAVAEQIRDFLLQGVVRNAVNVPSISREAAAQIRPYLVLGEKLGRFQGQLCTGSIEQIEIEYSGDAARLDVAPITVAVLKGLLESVTDQVNMVNAPVIAQERGIKVIESKASRSADFTSAITHARGRLRRPPDRRRGLPGQPAAHRAHRRLHARGDSRGPDALHPEPRPAGRGRHRRHASSATRGINISRMQLALQRERGEAAMLVNVDAPPPDSVLETLRALPNVISARLLELGP